MFLVLLKIHFPKSRVLLPRSRLQPEHVPLFGFISLSRPPGVYINRRKTMADTLVVGDHKNDKDAHMWTSVKSLHLITETLWHFSILKLQLNLHLSSTYLSPLTICATHFPWNCYCLSTGRRRILRTFQKKRGGVEERKITFCKIFYSQLFFIVT